MKVALVGCGHIHTPGFVKRLKERENVQVKYVWDHDEKRATENAGLLEAGALSDVDVVWNDADVSAVVICSETDRHESLVLEACRSKKDMFVEKPLGFGSDDAFRMADAISEAGVRFQTGYFNRGRPEYRFVKRAIVEGKLGTVTRIRMSNCHSGAIRDFFTPQWLWMTDPAIAGVGAFGDLGTHVLDIVLWLIESKVKRVTAAMGRALGKYTDACDEYGEGMIEFENGTIGTIAAGWVDVADPVKLVVSGTKGHAAYIDGRLYVESELIGGADGKTPFTSLPDEWPHAFELFLDAVAGLSPPDGETEVPLVSPCEAARRSDVMEALYRAAADSSWVAPKEG